MHRYGSTTTGGKLNFLSVESHSKLFCGYYHKEKIIFLDTILALQRKPLELRKQSIDCCVSTRLKPRKLNQA